MSERSLFTVRRGETHTIILASPLSSSYTATISVPIYRLPGGRNSYSPASSVAETYNSSTFAGDASYGPGWYLTLSDIETAALDKGVYVAIPAISYTAPSTEVDKPLQWLLEVID